MELKLGQIMKYSAGGMACGFYVITKITPQRVTVQACEEELIKEENGYRYYLPLPSQLIAETYTKKPNQHGSLRIHNGCFISPWNGKVKVFDTQN